MNEMHVSTPNRLMLKMQTFVKMNLDLCLMACLLGEILNERFEEDEKDILMTIAK